MARRFAAEAVSRDVESQAAVWQRAALDGALDVRTGALAVAGGSLLMAYPVVMLNLRSKPYFRQMNP